MGAGSQNNDNLGEITEINITPFVDVVLVLLVIFMVATPALVKDVMGIQLPKSTTSDSKSAVTLSVVVNKAGQILINGESLDETAASTALSQALQQNPETQIIIGADKEAFHGDVVKAVDLVKSAGATRFAFQIEKP